MAYQKMQKMEKRTKVLKALNLAGSMPLQLLTPEAGYQ
jgi:hypothetical protein